METQTLGQINKHEQIIFSTYWVRCDVSMQTIQMIDEIKTQEFLWIIEHSSSSCQPKALQAKQHWRIAENWCATLELEIVNEKRNNGCASRNRGNGSVRQHALTLTHTRIQYVGKRAFDIQSNDLFMGTICTTCSYIYFTACIAFKNRNVEAIASARNDTVWILPSASCSVQCPMQF